MTVTLSLAIYATKEATVLEFSASHKSIISGPFPNYVFNISDIPKDDVNNLIAGTSKLLNINKATAVKVAVISFLLTASVVLPIVIIAAQS